MWKEYCTRTSKNIKNTIVSSDVKKNFYDDIEKFINNETFYAEKGLPYKRGYILYGEPGCGKTSLIKAIANQYQLPIFILDLSILENNNELTTAVSEINGFVTSEEKYLLVMEDVDRAKMFKNRNMYYYDEEPRKGITDDCLLNVLDGVDENYGRITIMTANNYEVLTKIKAMMRPGRIDMIVNITYCTKKQVEKIIRFYFKEGEIKLEGDIKITPTKLIQIILVLNNLEAIIKTLNKHKSFVDLSIEKLLGMKKECR
jgi:chaperone BCS1